MQPGQYRTFTLSAPDRDGSCWFSFFCPGCNESHAVPVGGSQGWSFDENYDHPTLSPSLLRNRDHANPTAPLCHTFVASGRIQFLGDCSHALAGQTIDIPALPRHMGGP